MPRAPRYQSCSSLFAPILPSNPASIDRCNCSWLAGWALIGHWCSVTTVSSWPWMSRHSRRRRGLMKLCRSNCSYCRLLSLCVGSAAGAGADAGSAGGGAGGGGGRGGGGGGGGWGRPPRQDGLGRRFAERLGFLRARRWQAGRAATGLAEPLPQLQIAAELALVVVEFGLRLVGLLLGLDGPVAHILHAQRAGNHQHLGQRLALARLDEHAAHARVERQARQFHPHGRELFRIVDRAQLGQQLVAVG